MKKREPEIKTFLKRFGVIPVLLVTLVLIRMFSSYLTNLKDDLSEINKDIKEGTTVVLSPDTDIELLSKVIYENGYCDSLSDAGFIASTLVERQKEGRLPSLFSLQKRDVGQIPATIADSLNVLSSILYASRERIGLTNGSETEYDPSVFGGSDSIVVVIERELEKTTTNWFRTTKERCEGVPVRLLLHYHDSLRSPQIDTLGFGFTNEDGTVVFRGLFNDSSYSVLPINEGFEFGRSQGVVGGQWEKAEFTFVEKEHMIPLFSNTTLRQIKNERSIIVRTPDEFREELLRSRNWLLVSWWLLAFIFLFFPKGRRKTDTKLPERQLDWASGLIVACCMFLSGLSVLMMFSMRDPVNDAIMGRDMTIGVAIGVGAAIVLQFFDLVKRYNRGKFPFYSWFGRFRGLGWLVMALGLTGLLFTPLGRSVGGMRVNLQLPFLPLFQPSEIAKYLIVLFTSIFFTENIDRIIHYSNEFETNLGRKTITMLGIIVGLSSLMVIYFILGDMGPGLVLGITFVLLYSFSKSKQDILDGEMTQWKKFLRCDFMRLIYGVVSYALVLLLFRGFNYWYIVDSVLWLIVWLLLGVFPIRRSPVRKPIVGRLRFVHARQVHETAIIMNFVIFLFIFGSNAGKEKSSGVLSRLEQRTNMCTNTWGGMDKVIQEIKKGDFDPQAINALSDPVSNTQVAHGLWALASGGFWGQGWGRGKPSVVPACHTDMILSSIGEQWGWIGLYGVVFAYFLLLGLVAWKGIQKGEKFTVFLCMGIAFVTAVQLFIIALGSAGVIPLTGVTVPLLSYGKVSMILNILAFGLVLSLVTKIEGNTPEEENHRRINGNNAKAYKRPCWIAFTCFTMGCILTLFVWARYQWGIFQRDRTLVQPAFVINNQGDPVLEYNPRIAIISSEMYTGRIFDRNGLMLATSNKDDISGKVLDSLESCGVSGMDALKRRHLKRYYPFGDDLFFMIGDLNTGLLFSYDENNPVGYMAEAQHLSYLRGYDNVLYDKEGNPVKIRLVSNKKRDDRFLQPRDYTIEGIVLRDYSALLPYLKDGSGSKLRKHNASVEKGEYDLYLTLDASLQMDLQKTIADYVKNGDGNDRDHHLKNNNLLRVSVVVLNAKNGDLLASANYPKPNCQRISDEIGLAQEQGKRFRYSANNKGSDWKAYVDRDLGTTLQTAPGSTAKVMSAMAGLRKMGTAAADTLYYVSPKNIIENGLAKEPNGHRVSMEEAIVKSSNCYFINLVNDQKLFPELEIVYKSIGASVGEIVPYYYRYGIDETEARFFHDTVSSVEDIAYRQYERFRTDPERDEIKMNKGEWKWAWGQGFSGHELKASPLNMARLASAIVNDGVMPYTQYVIVKHGRNKEEKELRQEGSVTLLSKEEAAILRNIMKKETLYHKENRARVSLPSNVGGKTGTAERTIYYLGNPNGIDINDGWYMFFVEKDRNHDPLAVVVRLERGVGSSTAVRLSKELVGVLQDHHYMK